ncbi:MAG: DUF6663 family protein [Haloarculaceae archaeon]
MDERPYRVLADPRDADRWLLVDVERGERASVAAAGYEGDLGDRVASLAPGNRVVAAFDWTTDPPRFARLQVETRTRFRFVRTDEPLFEAARQCWQAARDAGEAMNVRVTHGTDNEPNGVVYTFADGPGADRFAEFREGRRPLDPLLDRVERVAPPYETFVIDAGEPFVVVYVVLDPEGLLAETVRDTYLD